MSDPFGLNTGWYGGATPAASDDELQADVMRFMAILAFCLVAIFAIVQSMPLDTVVSDTPAAEPATRVTAPQAPQPARANPPEPAVQVAVVAPLVVQQLHTSSKPPPPIEPVTRAVPTPAPSATPNTTPPAPQMALPRERAAAELPPPLPPTRLPVRPRAQPEPAPAAPAPPVVATRPPAPVAAPTPAPRLPAPSSIPQEGFALRFENDDALMSLVTAGRVGLYVVQQEQASREAWALSTRGGRLKFAPADAPRQINEMTPHTVPADVREAFVRAAGSALGASQVWGVTLPPITRSQIQRLLASATGGELVIDRTAGVTLNQRPSP